MSSTRASLKLLLKYFLNKAQKTIILGKFLIALTIKVRYCHSFLKLKVSTAKKSASSGYHERSLRLLQNELRACRDDFRLWHSLYKYE
jgi:hypothetical protein